MWRLTGIVARVARESDRAGFVASRVLWASRLCHLISFGLPDGYRMRFYPSSESTAFWRNRHFRPADATLLRRYLRPGDTFVDVGANVGNLSLLAWTRVRPGGRVVAIEAHPRTCGFLAGNVRLNGFPIETHNVAIGARPGSSGSPASAATTRITPSPIPPAAPVCGWRSPRSTGSSAR